MSDVPYIMATQDPKELWLVDGENKFRVSRDMYLLLAGNGADLPPTYDIADVLAENAKLRELLSDYQTCTNRSCPECRYYDECFDGNHVACCIAIDILDKRAQEFGIGVRDELGTQVQP